MGKHALLSPSSSYRWMNCTPSALLEADFQGETTAAAEEGTAAHAFCEHKLKKALHRRSRRPVSEYDTDEMQEHTDAYIQYVMEQVEAAKQTCADPLVLVERQVDFSEYVPEGYGTADCIIAADENLHVIDFKYGQGVLVNVEHNSQLMCYGIGALNLFDGIYDIKTVTLHIFQPRRENVQSWTITVDELKDWAENELKPKALMAMNGEGEYNPGPWCKFCNSKIRCRARAEENMRLAQMEFRKPPLLDDDEIVEVLKLVPDLTKWAEEIKDYALDQAVNHGKVWDGFKVVEGRSIRRYKDEDAVAEAAKANGFDDIYRRSLITLTEMQKLMGKKKFEEILGKYIIKPQGAPTLVPVTDKRPEMNVTNAIQEFNEEE